MISSCHFQAIFSVSNPHPDIYLHARIEKVLTGSVSQGSDPYTKSPDAKAAAKIFRQIPQFCSKLGHYRMPFAWAVRLAQYFLDFNIPLVINYFVMLCLNFEGGT